MTSTNVYHLLNGDALKAQMADSTIEGAAIVVRECLMDGPLDGNFPVEFYQKRAAFIANDIGDIKEDQYFQWTVAELDKIKKIPSNKNSMICLWFEDDLFCQVNMWFALHLLALEGWAGQIYWVRPLKSSRYSFGHFHPKQLGQCYAERERITSEDISLFDQLWKGYIEGNISIMVKMGDTLSKRFPAIRAAVQLHIDRIPNGDNPGRPIQVLKEIMEREGKGDFGKIFRQFNEQLPEYGFGDLQVRSMLKNL